MPAPRDYICRGCHLLYTAPCPHGPTAYRAPCPACGHESPAPTDTAECVYYERALSEEYGVSLMRNLYWFRPEWVSPGWAQELRTAKCREGSPHPLAPPVIDFQI